MPFIAGFSSWASAHSAPYTRPNEHSPFIRSVLGLSPLNAWILGFSAVKYSPAAFNASSLQSLTSYPFASKAIAVTALESSIITIESLYLGFNKSS